VVTLAIGLCISLPAIRRQNTPPAITLRELNGALHNKYFVAFLILGMFITIPILINQMFLPLIITDLGGSVLDITFAISLSAILEIVVLFLVVRYMKLTLSTLFLGLTIVTLLIALRWNLMSAAILPMHVVLIQLFNALTLGGFYFMSTRLISLLLPKPFRSSGQTITIICWSGIAGGIAGLLGGWMLQSFGAVILYKTLVYMTLCATVGFAIIWSHIRQHGYVPDNY
jgi:MFS transporter, PPP family, 3-phenylpropionic acid transporter